MRKLQTFIILCLLASCPSWLRGEVPPAFDATDMRAVELALRGIKMTPHDLTFQKTNVESELVLQKARTFLQQPLTLPAYGRSVASDLQGINSLQSLVSFSHDQLEVSGVIPLVESTPVVVDPGFLTNVPPAVATAIQIITASASQVRQELLTSLPTNQVEPFVAFTIETLSMGKDDAELKSGNGLGIRTDDPRSLFRRADELDLQDGELANTILNASDDFNRPLFFDAAAQLADSVDRAIKVLQDAKDDPAMHREFQVETDTPLGKIIIGGAGHNVYTNEAFLIIDTGGDDTYRNSAGGANGLVGRPISIVIDLGGNDQFVSERSFSQGSGVFGIGILAALGSNCTFKAKHVSQGAAFFGCGMLMTGEGQQTFEADMFCQGAAMFGAGILWQRGGDTKYKAAQMTQGFGGTSGIGLLLDESGNDSYASGGKYPCGWIAGHNFSLSQGFGYGMRPYAGGGVGILCDLKGDDHYVADVYGQGASYWYSVGLLLDLEGNDSYEAYHYCQGAGIHLSSAALIDWSGNDTYAAGHICQGAAHDYAVGMLIDRAGDDKYSGNSTAQGSAINNSFAMLLDHSGNDVYEGIDLKRSQATGSDGEKREYGSIALMLDLGGDDKYSHGQTNNEMWLNPLYGAGLDCEAAKEFVGQAARLPNPETAAGGAPALQQPDGKRLYAVEPVDPHEPTEQLVRRALSDKPDAAAAGDELMKRAGEVLPYLLTRVDSPEVLMRVRTESLIDELGTNSIPMLIDGIDNAKNDEVARLCCYFLARFNEKARAATPHILPLINRDKTRTVAFYTLGHLHAHEAFAPAVKALDSRQELVRLRAAQALGRIGDSRAAPRLIVALGDEMWDVRYAATEALVGYGRPSIAPLHAAFAKASPRARPHIIEALAKLGDGKALELAREQYKNDDPLVRKAVMKQLNEQLAAAAKKH